MMTAERVKVRFESDGIDCTGYLYRPASAGSNTPCVVMAPGFSGTQDTPAFRAVAEAFVEAGFIALTFDYRTFGESAGAPRQLVSIRGQVKDLHAAVRFARSHPGIDPDRIALWGTSLGGGHVVSAAAEDPRIAAVVAQIPFNGFPKRVEGRSFLETLRLLGAMFYDTVRGWFGRLPYYIPAVGKPGDLAVMASPQAQRTIEAMQSAHWQNEVAPRVLFSMMRYKPGNRAYRLTMPLLVCIAEHDREVPPELSREIADHAVHGEAKTYPYAHFDFYRPDVRDQVVADQIAFLEQHLMADGQ